jgi:membrane protein
MLKNWYTRLARIASGSFGSAKEDGFSLETSLTKFERFVHFWVLVVRSFVRNRCPVRASALSYTTLLGLIPVLAVAMGVTNAILESKGEAQIRAFIEEFVEKVVPSAALTKPSHSPPPAPPPAEVTLTNLDAFQFDIDYARDKLGHSADLLATNEPVLTMAPNLNPEPSSLLVATRTNQINSATNATSAASSSMSEAKQTVANQAANFIYGFAKKSSPKTLGFTGMFFLILTAIMVLTRVEETFNDIWGVTRGRDWWSRITNYTFTIGFGPVLLIIALGLMNSPGLQKSQELIRHIPFLEPMLTRVLPLFIICFTFTLFYKLVPNTKVDFGAALVGGTLAGLSWHGYNKIAVWIAASAVRGDGTSAVYAGLAIIPLLMGGLYMVWLTVLFGAQVAYAFQNRASYLQDRLVENVNQRGREFVALRLMTCIGQRFHRGLPPGDH